MTSKSVHDDSGVPQSPAGWWPLDDGSHGVPAGAYAADASGNGQTGLFSGAATWGSGYAAFTGSGEQGITTSGPVVNTAGSFSVSAWVNLAGDTSSYQGIVSEHSSEEDGFRLQYDAGSGKWTFGRATADTATSPTIVSAVSGSAAQTGTWTQLAGTYDASTGTLTLYVNGAQSGTTATDSTPYQASGPLAIGQDEWEGSAGDWFDGDIAGVQVYPYALSASQVSSLYGRGRTGWPQPAGVGDRPAWQNHAVHL